MIGAAGPQPTPKKLVHVDSKAQGSVGGNLPELELQSLVHGERFSSLRSSTASVKVLPQDSLLVYTCDPSKNYDYVPPSSPKFLDLTHMILFPHPLPILISPQSTIPVVRKYGVRVSLETLSKRFECEEHQTNLLQFWFLDIIADCMWRAQDEFRFDTNQQLVVLEWVVFVFELIADAQLDLDRPSIISLFCEALRMAEENVKSGSSAVPSPNALFSVIRPTDAELASVPSVQSFCSSRSSVVESEASAGSYLGLPDGRLFRLPCGDGNPDLGDEECLSSSISTISEVEETNLAFPTMTTMEEVPPPSEITSYDEEEFYKPDMRTPPRFKDLTSEESGDSFEISIGSVSKLNASSQQLFVSEYKKWFEVPRKPAKRACLESELKSKLNLDENDLPGEKEVLKAFFDFNYWQLKKEMMADENQGWVSSTEHSLSQGTKEMKEKKAEIREDLLKYIVDGKEQFQKLNEQVFVNYCVLLAIKNFVFE